MFRRTGHLRGKHNGYRLPMLLGYIFVLGPAIGRFLARTGLPHWALALLEADTAVSSR